MTQFPHPEWYNNICSMLAATKKKIEKIP
jgi:hypothetical protein